MLLPFISGVLGILSLSSFGSWLVVFASLAPAFYFLIKEKKFWRLFLGVFLFRFILGFGTGYFTFDPFFFLDSVGIFTGLALSIYVLNLFLDKKFEERTRQVAVLICLPFSWILWDYLASQFSFLPTYDISLGNALGASPFVGLARFGGIIPLTFYAALINAILLILILEIRKKVKDGKKYFKALSGFAWKLVASLVMLILLGLAISQYEVHQNYISYGNLQRLVKVAVVSSEASFDKSVVALGPDAPVDSIHQLLSPIKKDLSVRRFDLIVFPENMITEELNSVDNEAEQDFGILNQGNLVEAYRELAIELKTPILATFTTLESKGRYKTNLLFVNDGSIKDISHKSRLTFISEYWPFGSWHPFYFDWIARLDPEVIRESPIWDASYEYKTGEEKTLSFNDLRFAPLICVEAHYPYDFPALKSTGAQFFIHTSNNEWVRYGLSQYLYLSDNLRKIESVWLNVPIIINGRYEKAGIILSDGEIQAVDFNQSGRGYGIWEGEIRY